MIWNISGGVADQPNVPSVDFGFGRPNGWFDAEIVTNGERVVSTPSSSEVTTLDRVNLVSEPGVFAQNFTIVPTIYPRPGDTNQQPVATITDNGGVRISEDSPYKLETLDDGNGIEETVTLTTSERTLNLPVTGSTRESGDDATTFVRFTDGSLAKSCEDAVNDRIVGATTAMLPIFVNYAASHASGNYVRNPDCWAYDLREAMSGISQWNSNSGPRKAGTLLEVRDVGGNIRRDIIALAAHYEAPVGTDFRMTTGDNVTHTRKAVAKLRHPDYSPYFPDVTLYLMESEFPEGINPVSLLPANYEDYLPTGPEQIATLCLDQEEKALVTDLQSFTATSANFKYPDTPEEQVLYENKISGDSGNPAFLIVGTDLVCLTLWTYGGAGSGTFLTPQIPTLNTMINQLYSNAGISTGAYLQTVDLSSFTDFS